MKEFSLRGAPGASGALAALAQAFSLRPCMPRYGTRESLFVRLTCPTSPNFRFSPLGTLRPTSRCQASERPQWVVDRHCAAQAQRISKEPMANGPARAEFWKEFVTTRCGYPAPDRLRAQFTGAEFCEFCECGCNSFAVKVRANVPPLVPSGGGYRAIYTADFKLADDPAAGSDFTPPRAACRGFP